MEAAIVWPRAIIHLDLDAFYASVEQRRDPSLAGRPVIVGGYRGAAGRVETARGVVCAASYEARPFGVRSAMPLSRALRLCPQAVLVPADFPAYREASERVFAAAKSVTSQVEPLSLDEAYLDVTGSIRRFGSPPDVATRLRDEILAATGLHASFGVATCKVVAKVASDLRKPRGFVVVPPGDEAAFLAPLPLRALPGLGPATERALTALGISTLGQLAALPEDVLRRRVGEHAGRGLWERARGVDASAVAVPSRPRSISREQTFAHDVAARADLDARVRELAADVGRRLRAGRWQARTVTLKLRYTDFSTPLRQRALGAATDSDRVIAATAMALLDETWTGRPLRLLGVGVGALEEAAQLDLFNPALQRDSRLDRTLDELRRRFGDSAPRRGAPAAPLHDMDVRGDDLRRLAKDDAGDR